MIRTLRFHPEYQTIDIIVLGTNLLPVGLQFLAGFESFSANHPVGFGLFERFVANNPLETRMGRPHGVRTA